jgi:hypothetical protein
MDAAVLRWNEKCTTTRTPHFRGFIVVTHDSNKEVSDSIFGPKIGYRERGSCGFPQSLQKVLVVWFSFTFDAVKPAQVRQCR